jgi:hypothetical protein
MPGQCNAFWPQTEHAGGTDGRDFGKGLALRIRSKSWTQTAAKGRHGGSYILKAIKAARGELQIAHLALKKSRRCGVSATTAHGRKQPVGKTTIMLCASGLYAAKQLCFPWSPTCRRQRPRKAHAGPNATPNARHAPTKGCRTCHLRKTQHSNDTPAHTTPTANICYVIALRNRGGGRNANNHAGAQLTLNQRAGILATTPLASSIGPFARAWRAGSAEGRGIAARP